MAGDLNFRLNETDGEQVLREIVRGAEENDYSELLAKDQLTELIQNKSIFSDYEEPFIHFPPTFKLQKRGNKEPSDFAHLEGVRSLYKMMAGDSTKRTPSYVDRILWHALPGCRDSLQVAGFPLFPPFTQRLPHVRKRAEIGPPAGDVRVLAESRGKRGMVLGFPRGVGADDHGFAAVRPGGCGGSSDVLSAAV